MAKPTPKRAHRADPLYADLIWRFEVPEVPTESWVRDLREQQTQSKQAWASVLDTHQRKMADTSQTEHGRLLASAKVAKAVLESRRAAFEQHKAGAEAERRRLAEKLERNCNPPSDPGEAALFADLRAYLRSLPLADRGAIVDQESNKPGNDNRLLRAAIAGPASAGLLPADQHAAFRERYLVNVATNEYGYHQRLGQALEHAEYGMQELENHVNDLVDFQTAEVIERNAA
jgi:hypothetical protein